MPGNPWETFDVENIVDIDGEKVDWLPADADPDALPFSVIKRKSVAIGAGSRAVVAAFSDEGYEAAAYRYGEYAHVRRVPKGFGFMVANDELLRGVLLGEGLNDFAVQMGVWLPDDKKLVVPEDTRIVELHITRRKQKQSYRGLSRV